MSAWKPCRRALISARRLLSETYGPVSGLRVAAAFTGIIAALVIFRDRGRQGLMNTFFFLSLSHSRSAGTCNHMRMAATLLRKRQEFEVKKLNPKTEKAMVERFGKDTIIALATMENGMPHVRYVNAYYEQGAFYIITHRLSNKMRHIERNAGVAIAGEWFTAHGNGASLGFLGNEENELIARRLKDAFAEWINNGHMDLGDKNTVILRVELTEGLLLSHGSRYEL